jgi:diaminopimelate epimerase
MKFYYYSGSGNLFTIIDNRFTRFSTEQLSQFALKYCKKFDKFTMATEGFIALNSAESNEIDVQFFNPDGSTGMMCGNGARSIVQFALDLHLIDESINTQIALAGRIYNARVYKKLIYLEFPKPIESIFNKEIKFDDSSIIADFVNVGSPHLLFDYSQIPFSDKFEYKYYPLADFAQPIRNNLQTFPNGVNVSIYKIISHSSVYLRTYERGVEAETGACGTASISTAFTLFSRGQINESVSIIPTSQIPLKVNIRQLNNQIDGFELTGLADKIGYFEIDIE